MITAIPDLTWCHGVLVSFSTGDSVFHLILGGCPKNSLNVCPNGAVPLFNVD